jgi:hypothetical protein
MNVMSYNVQEALVSLVLQQFSNTKYYFYLRSYNDNLNNLAIR